MMEKIFRKDSFGTRTDVSNSGELTEENFDKLKNSGVDLEKQKEDFKEDLFEAYLNIIDILRKYLELKEEYYSLIALWIIGTYFHDSFFSYPYLFFNAMKGSGKSRALNLIVSLSKDGEIVNSLTEAVLFRTKGTIAIDEFEGIERKGQENLRELLNSAYKKGVKDKRMRQKKTVEGVQQVVEEFEVFRPVIIANILGMESVLGDRCICLVLEKSFNPKITNLIEIFREDEIVKKTIELLNRCSLCRCSFSVERYKEWNNYVICNNNNYTNNTNNTNNTNYTNFIDAFKSLNLAELNGRDLELSFPLFLLAYEISLDVLKETTLTLKKIFSDKKVEDLVYNSDVSLIDFVSQIPDSDSKFFKSIRSLTSDFKEFLQVNEDWLNSKWMGRALKRTSLIIEKRRISSGVEVRLDIQKALNKIPKFK